MKRKASINAILLLALAHALGAQEIEKSVFGLSLFPAHLERQHIPLSRALGDVGSYVRNGYVLFGLELRSRDGQEPMVSVDLKPGSTLGDALGQLLNQIPGYKLEVISLHLVNIYPEGAKDEPEDVLNTPVPEFEAINADPSQILSRPKDFIPELAARLAPETHGAPEPRGVLGTPLAGIGTATVTLHLKNATVRQVLNAVSEAMEQFPPDQQPLGWMYVFQPDPSSPIGGNHSWKFLWSAPANWKTQASKPQ